MPVQTEPVVLRYALIIAAAVLVGQACKCGTAPGGDNAAPVANAGPDRAVTTGTLVALDGSASTDPEASTLTYVWSFVSVPAASNPNLSDSTAVDPTFTPDVDGEYEIGLVVNDGARDSAQDTVVVTSDAPNAAPVANAGPDQAVTTGTLVTLDGSGSTDPETSTLSYVWSFVSVPATSSIISDLSDATAVGPTFTPDVDGEYVIGLVVSDGDLDSAQDTVTITAHTPNSIPVANAGLDRSVHAGLLLLDGSASTDADNDPLTYAWTLYQMPLGSDATLSSSTGVRPVLHVDLPGNYVVMLVVNDGSASSDIDTLTITVSALTGTIRLPVTGQTTCYDALGNTIDCTGSGQDGEVLAGVIGRSTRFGNNNDATITDHRTGLMWLLDGSCFGAMNWETALATAAGFNSDPVSYTCVGYYTGHSDWRLANRNELLSLVDFSQFAPALPSGHLFLDATQDPRWSATTDPTQTSSAVFIDMSTGRAAAASKDTSYTITLVRDVTTPPARVPTTGQTSCHDQAGGPIDCAGTGQDGEIGAGVVWPSPRFTDSGDGTVTDNLTGLVWLRDASCFGPTAWETQYATVTAFNADPAPYACEGYAGYYADWRIPNIVEMESLVGAGEPDVAAWLMANGFTNVEAAYVMTSTTLEDSVNTDQAWFVDLQTGRTGATAKADQHYSWPVRDAHSSWCGDNVVNSAYEVCDGTDLPNPNCSDYSPFVADTVECLSACNGVETSSCYQCTDCRDCENQACVEGMCGACLSDDDCCAPWFCFPLNDPILGHCYEPPT